jgi:ABC-type multidrug transport system ATPase subunit
MGTVSGTTILDLLDSTSGAHLPAAPTRGRQPVRSSAQAPAVRRRAGVGPCVEFVDLSTRWRGHVQFAAAVDLDTHREQVFEALSLTVPAGRITVLLGARGAGKSLLACHLLGVSAPDRGAVLVDGRSVWEQPERARRELLGDVGVLRGGARIQDSAIADSRTVFDNVVVQLARRGRTESVEQHAREYLDRFDLTAVAHERPAALDPGARRRLALALALVGDPSLVVIDDPGQALDLHHYERVSEEVRSWQARTGATMLITVRSLEIARRLGDRVVVLRDGRVLAQGGAEQVLAGVVDDECFQRRFGTNLGGFAEADPERIRRAQRSARKAENRRHLGLVLAFLALGITIMVMLLAGVISYSGGPA